MNFFLQSVPQPILLDLEVISNLKIQPESLTHAKEPRQAKRGVSTDCPLPMNDLVDSASRHTNVLGKPILAEPHRIEKLFEEDLSWVYRWKLLGHTASQFFNENP